MERADGQPIGRLTLELNEALDSPECPLRPCTKDTFENKSRLGSARGFRVKMGRLAHTWLKATNPRCTRCDREIE